MKILNKVINMKQENETLKNRVIELETEIAKLNRELKEYYEIKKILCDNKEEAISEDDLTPAGASDFDISGDDSFIFDDEVVKLEDIEPKEEFTNPFEKELAEIEEEQKEEEKEEEEFYNPFEKELAEVEEKRETPAMQIWRHLQEIVDEEERKEREEKEEKEKEVKEVKGNTKLIVPPKAITEFAKEIKEYHYRTVADYATAPKFDLLDVEVAPTDTNIEVIPESRDVEVAPKKVVLSAPVANVVLPETIFIRGKGANIDENRVRETIETFDLDSIPNTRIPKSSEYKAIYSSISKILNRKTLTVIRERGGADRNNTLPKVRREPYLAFLKAIKETLTPRDNAPKGIEDIAKDIIEEKEVESNNGLTNEIKTIKDNLNKKVENAIAKANELPKLKTEDEIFKWTINSVKHAPKSLDKPNVDDLVKLTTLLKNIMNEHRIGHLYSILCANDRDYDTIEGYYPHVVYKTVVDDLIKAIHIEPKPLIDEHGEPLVGIAEELIQLYKGRNSMTYAQLKVELMDLRSKKIIERDTLLQALKVFVPINKREKIKKVSEIAGAVKLPNYRPLQEFIGYIQRELTPQTHR